MRSASSKLWWFRPSQHWQILKIVQIESEDQDSSSHPEGLGRMLMTSGWRPCQDCDLFVVCEPPEADHVNLIATNKMDDDTRYASLVDTLISEKNWLRTLSLSPVMTLS